MSGAIRYRTYVNGSLDAEHETLEGLAEYLYLMNLMSEDMSDRFLRDARECTDVYDIINGVLQERLTGVADDTMRYMGKCYSEALAEAVGSVLKRDSEGGRLEYTVYGGDEVLIESSAGRTKSPSRKAPARRKTASKTSSRQGGNMRRNTSTKRKTTGARR